ncbi:MAG: MBL fold metallo-hydrolase [Leptospiraceae bacterium]|nr:MAG: MBL fold metallo-hydrolase [Leptospiraceae bacterium]
METIQIDSIKIIDGHYVREGLACCYLMIDNNKGIIIETNTNHSIPYILREIEKSQLKPEDIEYIIITHVHLDHAGGAGKLMQICKNAKLLAHPKAARHIINPERLIQSSIQVYGEDNFKKLYGDIIPVPEDRVRIMEDGEEIVFGNRKLKFIYTRGHANHHFVIYDSQSNGVFTGDSFGLAYPILQEKGLFIIPTTSPTDFDPGEAKISIDKILNTNCDKVFLTHYGMIQDLENAKNQLIEGINLSEDLLYWCLKNDISEQNKYNYVKQSLLEYFEDKIKRLNLEKTKERWEMLQLDAELNTMGILYSAKRLVKKSN